MIQARSQRWLPARAAVAAFALAALAVAPGLAFAADPVRWQLNMGKGVTASSGHAYDAHMFVLWVCVVIGLIVFGAMGYAVFKFRKSKGAVAAQFSHSTKAEIVWTVVPVILLVGMAWPATAKLIAMYDTRDSEMTVKITGFQWMWKYEYLGEDVEITSRLDRDSDRIRQSGARPDPAANPHYLLDVDNPLVLPTGTKIRFVITADDVIHAWWVPALGWKQDAIPGLINEAWTEIAEPGTYRCQCAELCGKDHGFMPIVVQAVPRAEFDAWLAGRKAAGETPATPSAVPAEGDGTAPRSVNPDAVEDLIRTEADAAAQPATNDAAPAAPAAEPAAPGAG